MSILKYHYFTLRELMNVENLLQARHKPISLSVAGYDFVLLPKADYERYSSGDRKVISQNGLTQEEINDLNTYEDHEESGRIIT